MNEERKESQRLAQSDKLKRQSQKNWNVERLGKDVDYREDKSRIQGFNDENRSKKMINQRPRVKIGHEPVRTNGPIWTKFVLN